MGVVRTRAGLRTCRATAAGGQVVLVAPASSFDRAEFDRGVAQLHRLGLTPRHEETVFARQPMRAGPAHVRADALRQAWADPDASAIVAVRGGYGSIEVVPLLSATDVPDHPAAFVGYSDVTSLHVWLNLHVGVTSVHGAMIDGRLARGSDAFDEASFLASLGAEPLGEVMPDGVDVLRPGEVEGPLFGGTITQLAASLGTPYAFMPPAGSVLFLEDVAERPYRLHRMLTQLKQAGVLAKAAGIVVGQMPSCDEPGGEVRARDVLAEAFDGFPGPVLFGFPSGHTTTPMVSLPLGVQTRIVTAGSPRLVVLEAAAH